MQSMRAKNCAMSVAVTVHLPALKELAPVHWRSRLLGILLQFRHLVENLLPYHSAIERTDVPLAPAFLLNDLFRLQARP